MKLRKMTDRRHKALELLEQGKTFSECAVELNLSLSQTGRWLRLHLPDAYIRWHHFNRGDGKGRLIRRLKEQIERAQMPVRQLRNIKMNPDSRQISQELSGPSRR